MKNICLSALCLLSTLSFGMQKSSTCYTLKGVDSQTFSLVQRPDCVQMGFISAGKGIDMQCKVYNGLPVYDRIHATPTDSKETVIEMLVKAFKKDVVTSNV